MPKKRLGRLQTEYPKLTVIAVLEVPPQIANRSDDDLVADACKLLGNGWPTHDDTGRLFAEPRFVSVARGVTAAAVVAGSEREGSEATNQALDAGNIDVLRHALDAVTMARTSAALLDAGARRKMEDLAMDIVRESARLVASARHPTGTDARDRQHALVVKVNKAIGYTYP